MHCMQHYTSISEYLRAPPNLSQYGSNGHFLGIINENMASTKLPSM